MIFSDVIKDQTALAWQYLEKAKPLITYKKLVPVSEAQIAQYESTKNKVVPLDFCYWLTTYGSGRIEFLEGELKIVSIYELMKEDCRPFSSDDPQDCWNRIYIGYLAPSGISLDSTIIDENGCAPVVLTEPHGNKVVKVLISSWPMYIIKRIIEIATSLKDRNQNESLTAEQITAIDELANQNIEMIDDALGKASERAVEHNNTKIEEVDYSIPNAEMLTSMLDFLEKCHDKMESRKLISRLLAALSRPFRKDDKFTKVVMEIEEQIDKGYASLSLDLDNFFKNEVEPRHADGLKALLGHDCRELRKLAELGWLRINPGEAEKQAERMWDWLDCAENWMVVDKSWNETTRCLREAEKLATNFTEWLACAEFWLDKIRNVSEARRCLLIAEENVANTEFIEIENLIHVTSRWVDLHEIERAKNNLLRAEAASNQSFNAMIWASQIWRKDIKDIESAKRALKKAQQLVPAHEPYFLQKILREWESIGDLEEIENFRARNHEYLNT